MNGNRLASASISVDAVDRGRPRRCLSAARREHAFRGVDGGDVNVCGTAGKLNRDLGGAGAEVEDMQERRMLTRAGAAGNAQEVGHELRVDGGVIHRVVFARVLVGVHHFGFKDAREHNSIQNQCTTETQRSRRSSRRCMRNSNTVHFQLLSAHCFSDSSLCSLCPLW